MIRHATVDDLRRMYEFIEQYYKEAREKRKYAISFNWEKVANHIWTWLHNDFCVNLITDHGMLTGEIQPAWFSDDVIAHLHVCFVEKPYRNGITARGMIRRFNEIAEGRGALWSYWDDWAGITEGDMLEQFLEKLGYEVHGNVYRKEFPNAIHRSIHTAYCGSSGPAVS